MLGFYCIGVVTAVKAKPMKKNKKKAKDFKKVPIYKMVLNQPKNR